MTPTPPQPAEDGDERVTIRASERRHFAHLMTEILTRKEITGELRDRIAQAFSVLCDRYDESDVPAAEEKRVRVKFPQLKPVEDERLRAEVEKLRDELAAEDHTETVFAKDVADRLDTILSPAPDPVPYPLTPQTENPAGSPVERPPDYSPPDPVEDDERCPTCGSDDPAIEDSGLLSYPCRDPFHDPVEDDERVRCGGSPGTPGVLPKGEADDPGATRYYCPGCPDCQAEHGEGEESASPQDQGERWRVWVCPECYAASPIEHGDHLCHNHTGIPKRMIEFCPASQLEATEKERDSIEAQLGDSINELIEDKEATEKRLAEVESDLKDALLFEKMGSDEADSTHRELVEMEARAEAAEAHSDKLKGIIEGAIDKFQKLGYTRLADRLRTALKEGDSPAE